MISSSHATEGTLTSQGFSVIERGKLYTLEQVREIARVQRERIIDLESAGLRTQKPSPGGKKFILGDDWIDFLRQIAEHEGSTNTFDPEKWNEVQERRKTEREQRRKREKRKQERERERQQGNATL